MMAAKNNGSGERTKAARRRGNATPARKAAVRGNSTYQPEAMQPNPGALPGDRGNTRNDRDVAEQQPQRQGFSQQ